MKIKKIGILTSGGDCPGLNAVIRAVVKKAELEHGWDVVGIKDGYEGLIFNRHRMLSSKDVSGILTLGGTVLGTTNRADPYRYPVDTPKGTVYKDFSGRLKAAFKKLKIDCLVCIGGDGTLGVSARLCKEGVPIVGVPKTIDNDVIGTDVTFGFSTAVDIAVQAIDRLQTTAESHHRVMILEVMGRNAGWIALYAGMAGGGDIILIPEIDYDIDAISQGIQERRLNGKRFTIIVISEGAKPKGGAVTVKELVKDGAQPIRLGGISYMLGKQIEQATGIESRNVVLGHLQRGGSPSAADRILGTQLGCHAVDFIAEGYFGHMVGVKQERFVKVPLAEVSRGMRIVPVDHPMIAVGRSLGVCFG